MTGLRDEWHVRHFSMTDLLLASYASNPQAWDSTYVTLVVPPYYMRAMLLAHAKNLAVLVLGIFVLTALALFLLLHCKVMRPLRQLFDKILHVAAHPLLPAQHKNGKPYSLLHDTDSVLARLDQHSAYQRAQREKLANLGAAVAKINHDMRNVLSAATLVSHSLTHSKDPVVARVAPRVTGAIDRAVNLCQQMLTYINAPQQLNTAATDMHGLLAEIRRGLAIGIAYHGPKTLCVDGGQFFRLIFNLADNAGKAGAKHVVIRITNNASGVTMDIADDGPGMDGATKKRLFKPFQAKNGSTGLGLSIARDIAFAHGGNLKLNATSPAGSVFRLSLPRHVLMCGAGKQKRRLAHSYFSGWLLAVPWLKPASP